jgi:hypothetical protein
MDKSILSLKILVAIILSTLINNSINSQSFITGDTLSSTITYVNINDTILPFIPKGGFNFDIDIDLGGWNDIRFHRHHNSSPSYSEETFSVFSFNNIQFVTLSISSDIDTLEEGAIIDNSLNWNNNFDGGCLYYYFDSNIPPPWGLPDTSHGVCNQSDIYVGFRKIEEFDTIYGWIYLDLIEPFKIRSFAIDKIVNNKIDSYSHKIITNIFPNPTNRKVNLEFSDNKIHQIKIFDLVGKAIIVKTEVKKRETIDLSSSKNGVYIISIQTDKEAFTTKIIKL